MRSPAVVFSVVAASVLSPTILGSPLPMHSAAVTTADHSRAASVAARGLGFFNDIFPRGEAPKAQPTSKTKVLSFMGANVRRDFWKKDEGASEPWSVSHPHTKRLDDTQTTGGNAHTGTAGAVDGGSVDSGDNGGMPTLMNLNSNNAGTGGGSSTGCAAGGKGASGGNASSGDSGTATGGRVRGSGGMMNVDSNNAGDAGESSSGCAEAGYSEGAGMNSQGEETPASA